MPALCHTACIDSHVWRPLSQPVEIGRQDAFGASRLAPPRPRHSEGYRLRSASAAILSASVGGANGPGTGLERSSFVCGSLKAQSLPVGRLDDVFDRLA